MKLFDLLRIADPDLDPARAKLHLAVWNGIENPLNVYLAGEFDSWQSWQGRRNFGRPFVISLIALPQRDRWLFAGAHDSRGCQVDQGGFQYDMCRRPANEDLNGRLVVSFSRSGRQSYLNAERWADQLEVAYIRPEPLAIRDFDGYSWTTLSKAELDIIVRQSVESWRAALSAVAGVYVIVDRLTGKMYVGSATAGEGIWSRWSAYSASGHGGNTELIALLSARGLEYADNFQFGILEVADSHSSAEDVLARESYWKNLLQTRAHGYNVN